MRVMAIQMEDNLFEEFKGLIEKSGKTQKAYVIDMIQNELDAQKQEQNQEQEVALNDEEKPVKWERENVIQAIDEFLLQNNRIPSQNEFRSDNGLPSYKAAQRYLEQSPAEYCNNRFEELQSATPIKEQCRNDFSMSI